MSAQRFLTRVGISIASLVVASSACSFAFAQASTAAELFNAKEQHDAVVAKAFAQVLAELDEQQALAPDVAAGPATPGLGADGWRRARDGFLATGEIPPALRTTASDAVRRARDRVEAAYSALARWEISDGDKLRGERLFLGRDRFTTLRALTPWLSVAELAPHVRVGTRDDEWSMRDGRPVAPKKAGSDSRWQPFALHGLPAAFVLKLAVRRPTNTGDLVVHLGRGASDGDSVVLSAAALRAAPQRAGDLSQVLDELRVTVTDAFASVELAGIEAWIQDRTHAGAVTEAVDVLSLASGDARTRIEIERIQLRALPTAKESSLAAAAPAHAPVAASVQCGGAVSVAQACASAGSPLRVAIEAYERTLDSICDDVERELRAQLLNANSSGVSDAELKTLRARVDEERVAFRCRASLPNSIPLERSSELEKRALVARDKVLGAYDDVIARLRSTGDAQCAVDCGDARGDFAITTYLAPAWSDAETRPLVAAQAGAGTSWTCAGGDWNGPVALRDDRTRAPFELAGELPLEFVWQARIAWRSAPVGGLRATLASDAVDVHALVTREQLDAARDTRASDSSGVALDPLLRITCWRDRAVVELNGVRVWCESSARERASDPADLITVAASVSLQGEDPSARFNVDDMLIRAIRSPSARRAPPPSAVARPAGPQATWMVADVKSAAAPTTVALLDGMRWLLRHQCADGSWSANLLDESCTNGSRCWPTILGSDQREIVRTDHYDEGLTALALLALLGAGHAPTSTVVVVDTQMGVSYTMGIAITSGLQWLCDRQSEDGSFSRDRYMYNEALSAMALVEAYGMTRASEWKAPAQKAIAFIVEAQKKNPSGDGMWGWRYESRSVIEARKAERKLSDAEYNTAIFDADTSVTAWCLWALDAARRASLDVSEESMLGASKFAHFVTETYANPTGRVGYLTPDGAGEVVTGTRDMFTYYPETMSSLGICLCVGVEQDPSTPFVRAALDRIVQKPPQAAESLGIDYYYWHAGTLGVAIADGPRSPRRSSQSAWKSWKKATTAAILSLQDKTDARDMCARGGWLKLDRWAYAGGPVYTTAMNLLTLEATLDRTAIRIETKAEAAAAEKK